MMSLLSLKIAIAKELFKGAVKFALKGAGRPIDEHYNLKAKRKCVICLFILTQFLSSYNARECSTNLDFARENLLIFFFDLIHKATWPK